MGREKQNFCAVCFSMVFLTTVKFMKSRKGHCSPPLVGEDNREGEAKFLRCSLYYEGAFSIMEPAEFSRISF